MESVVSCCNMMRRLFLILGCMMVSVSLTAQTLNVEVGSVTYQFPAEQAGNMVYSGGTTLTIMNKVFEVDEITCIYVDTAKVIGHTVTVVYEDTSATVVVAGNVAQYVEPLVEGAHVNIAQLEGVDEEITYTLSGESTDGEFFLAGSFKATLVLDGLVLANPSGAPVNIQNGKRIEVNVKSGTVNTLTDGKDNKQKGCFVSRGHTEFKGHGILNVYGQAANGIWSKEYVTVKNCTINVLSSVKDGLNCNQYFTMESGSLNIKNTGDDGLQVSLEDNGTEEDDTGTFTLTGGTLDIAIGTDAAKGIKAEGDVYVQGGNLTVTQTGNIVADTTGISFPTSVKSDGNIIVSGGTVTVNNTAAGGKGLSAEGYVNINENDTTTVVNVTADGSGGTVENAGSGSSTTASYKIYVSVPAGGMGGPGGGGAWRTIYLYKSDGTLVEQLTKTISKSSGYSTTTFYYYDFKVPDSGTYYFKSDDYTSRTGTKYAIQSITFEGPVSGEDIYYSINNSYSTSGTVRTYSLTNVTNTYGGSTDTSEDNGTAYNAVGIKADVSLTIEGGTIIVANNGNMSKSLKADTVTVAGGEITLNPGGGMKVISGDASYCSGIKCDDFIQKAGTLKITATGTANRGISAENITVDDGVLTIENNSGGQSGSGDNYTAKGLKADTRVALNGGTVTITMTGAGGKGIKSNGTYTQGTGDGSGPILTVNTSGSSFGSSSSYGGPGGGSSGSSAKAIKAIGAVTVYGGESTITTTTNGAEGLESKTQINIEGGRHYFKCYDDCINATKLNNQVSGKVYFNGGVTVCWSTGNDAVDSNAGTTGAITIGDGVVFAYTSRGGVEEGLDCDNNSYIQITGTGVAISAGGTQGGGGGWGGGSGSGNTISNAKQGYYFLTSSVTYSSGKYYTVADNGKNLVTYSFPTTLTSSLALFTATGMVKGNKYTVKYSDSEPTDATTAFHGLYLGSSAVGVENLISVSGGGDYSFTAQ